MPSSNGGDNDVSLGIARIAHEYGMPVLVRIKCLEWLRDHCLVGVAWPLCPQRARASTGSARLALSRHAGECRLSSGRGDGGAGIAGRSLRRVAWDLEGPFVQHTPRTSWTAPGKVVTICLRLSFRCRNG